MTFTKLPKAITAEELLSTPLPPVKWIIPGLLPAGLALFAGPSKAGKSWLTLWFCLQVAQGKPVWRREIESRTVLYLSLEDTLNRLQDRLFRLVGSEDTPEKLILQTECKSIGQGLEEQIVDFVHNYPDTGLVVIDTLQKVRSCDQSGSMYASDYKDVSTLKSLADKYGICILLIHHLRKQAASDPFDQISGSNGLMGAADTTWVMQRKRTSKNANIILTGRDLDRRTLYLHEENCIWLLDEEETAEEQRLKAVPEYLWRVAEYIEQAGKWQGTATELLSAAGVDGVLPHKLTRKIVEHFDTVFVPKDIHYETHRTSQTRLLKFSHSENDAKISNDADLIYKQGGTMAYIKKKSERKFKITVCNGYKVNGQKRMKAQTVTVPSSVPKRGIRQYVMAEAERIEKKFKYGVEESDQTHFEQYAENWLTRQEPFFKATTYAGYKKNLDIVYPLIGGIPLAKLLPMTLEEMCEELRKRPGRGGKCIKETTVQKYLETVSSVLEAAKKNDIIPFNPTHRVRKKHFEKEVQHIPQKYEMSKLMRAIQNEPILYRAYYTLAITTGLRRGELCALQWRDITGACELTVRRSRSCASGQIVESDTKSHRERIVTIPLGIWELLMALRQQQVLHSGVPDREQPIFTDPDGHVPHPDTFTRHLRKLYKKCGLPEEYHLHTLRHFYATYLLQEGTSKQVAASLLGHADTAFLERTYCHPQDVAKQQAANLMQDLLNNQNPCYVAFMKNKNRKAKKAG